MNKESITGEQLRHQQDTQDRLLTSSPWLESEVLVKPEQTRTSSPNTLTAAQKRRAEDIENQLQKGSPWLE